MKKMIFVVIIFVSLILIAEEMNTEETNWILYDDWVTGPGSGENKDTFLLPFGHFPYPKTVRLHIQMNSPFCMKLIWAGLFRMRMKQN